MRPARDAAALTPVFLLVPPLAALTALLLAGFDRLANAGRIEVPGECSRSLCALPAQSETPDASSVMPVDEHKQGRG